MLMLMLLSSVEMWLYVSCVIAAGQGRSCSWLVWRNTQVSWWQGCFHTQLCRCTLLYFTANFLCVYFFSKDKNKCISDEKTVVSGADVKFTKWLSLLLCGSCIGFRSQREYSTSCVCLLVHNMFVGHAPDYIASLLTPASDIPLQSSLRSSSNCDLLVPRTSRKIGDRALCVAAPHTWNRLPTDLKLLHSTASFKSKLQKFLFRAAYTGNTVWTQECAIGLIVGAHYKSLLLLLLNAEQC